MRFDQDLHGEQDEVQKESMIDNKGTKLSHPLEKAVCMEDDRSEQQLSLVLATIHSTGTVEEQPIDTQSQSSLNSTYDYQIRRPAYEAIDASNNLLPIHGTPNSAPAIMYNGLQGNFNGSSFTASVAPAQTLGVTSPESEHLLANHFQRPDQHHLWSALQCILISEWYNGGTQEPATIHGRWSTYHQFLEPVAGETSYICLFDGCVYISDREDRALAHIRAHVHHRPYVCGGQCQKSNW